MPAEHSAGVQVTFGPFVLDRVERTLECRGVETVLPLRAFRLLEALVRSPGRTVSKDQLVEEAWRGAHVSDTSLTEAISRLRGALGDEAREPRYVRTVHGRGYRFISPVKEIGRRSTSKPPTRRVRMAFAIAASMALLAFVGALWIGSGALDGAGPTTGPTAGSSTQAPRIAFDPAQGLAKFLLGVDRRDRAPQPRRYRLAEVTTDGAQVRKYGIPALPLQDLAVDRAGRRLAFSMATGQHSDVWVLEPRKGELRRVMAEGYSSDPVWTPNGRGVVVAHSRNSNFDLVLKEVDRKGPGRVLLEAPLDQFPDSWSTDGRSLVYSELHPETGYDLWLLQQRSDRSWMPSPLVRTPGDEAFGAISPDGRYVAFAAATGSRPDVFVVDLKLDRTTLRVSHDGGAFPFWSVAGDLLHYVKGDEIWTVATDEIGREAAGASPAPTTVEGVWLARSASAADRMVVAMLD